MIRLNKSAEPKVLADNAVAWLRDFLDTLEAGQDPTKTQAARYRHAEIKAALISETHGKCAYCEAKALVTGFGDVEHIIPKKLKPELRFSWANLTLACDVCNMKKGANESIIDPYEVDPDLHLRFFGPMLTVRPGSDVGLRTHTILDLNRAPLLEHRKEKLDDFVRRAREVIATKDDETRKILLQALISDARSAGSEFSACTRALILDMQSDGQLPEL